MTRVLLLALLLSPLAHAQEWTWAQSGGAINPDSGEGVAVDASGDICVTGTYETSATFGSATLTSAGRTDVFVARMSPDGAYLWATSLGGSTLDRAYAAAAADGACYVTGRYTGTADFGGTTLTSVGGTGDLFVAKLDDSGEVVWATSGGGEGNEIGHSIAADGQGGLVVTGAFSGPGAAQFGGTSLTSAGLDDAVVARLDAASGAWLWAQSFGSAQIEIARAVASGDDGTVTVAGLFTLSVTIGSTTLTSAGRSDVFVARYTVDGSVLWATRAGGTDSEDASAVAVGPDGETAVAGTFFAETQLGATPFQSAGLWDGFVAKVSPSGEVEWARHQGGPGSEFAYGVGIDPAGRVFITGEFGLTAEIGPDSRTAVGREDAFVAAYSASGAPLWSAQVGGSNIDQGHAIAIAPDGGVIVTGSFTFMAAAGPLTLSGPDENAFVARLGGAAVPAEPAPGAEPLALRVGPNPAHGAATVWLSPAAPGSVQVEVVDALGRTVVVREAVSGKPLALDVSALAPGLYRVRASGGGEVASHPLTVVR